MKLTKKLLEQLILEALPDPSQGLNNAVTTTKPDFEEPTKQTITSPPEGKKFVDTKKYDLVKKKASELASSMDRLPNSEMISRMKEIISQISAL